MLTKLKLLWRDISYSFWRVFYAKKAAQTLERIKAMVQEYKENVVNPALTENIAKELFDVYCREFDALHPDKEKLPNWNHSGNQKVWFMVAEAAIAKLQPAAVNSELPNDSKFGSGRKPASEAVREDVGNPTEHGKNRTR